jgi:hypothetical protein
MISSTGSIASAILQLNNPEPVCTIPGCSFSGAPVTLSGMAKGSEVDHWFVGKPAEMTLQRVREVILKADPRMTEYLKYGTIQFAFEGDFANFVQHQRKTVSLMFNRGARIPGKFPHLEGSGPSARFMRFADVTEVNQRSGELTKIVAAWCGLVTKA